MALPVRSHPCQAECGPLLGGAAGEGPQGAEGHDRGDSNSSSWSSNNNRSSLINLGIEPAVSSHDACKHFVHYIV
jgi:hypothetical protein